MLLSNDTLPTQESYEEVIAPAAEKAGFAAAAKNQFIQFFQNKGFNCVADAQQQLKAIYKKLTVRFSVSDAKIASDQGHAICYLSFTPLNKQYKIAVSNDGNEYIYTLMEDTFARSGTYNQRNSTFYNFEELLNTIFPKTIAIARTSILQSFFSFLF